MARSRTPRRVVDVSAVADRRPLDDIITSLVEVSSRLEGADIAKISEPDWTLLSQITTDLVRHNPAQISYSETNWKLQQLVKGFCQNSGHGMTRSEAPSLLRCLRRRHFGDQCMPAPDEASSLLGQGDDLAAATASAQVLAELLKRRAEACR